MPASKVTPNNSSNNTTATVVTIISLIFFLPVGLILMWAWAKWNTTVKIVVTIVGVLYAIFLFFFLFGLLAVIIINPVELQKNARDVNRFSDMTNAAEAINAQIDKANQSGEDLNICGVGTPTLCEFTSDKGKDWVPFKLDILKTLPVDPLNNVTYKYTYCSDGSDWEINAVIESEKYADKTARDGGDNPKVIERGSKLTLCQ